MNPQHTREIGVQLPTYISLQNENVTNNTAKAKWNQVEDDAQINFVAT